MKLTKIIALALCLVTALAPVTVFADGEEEKYALDPTHITFTADNVEEAIIYRASGGSAARQTEYSIENGELKLTASNLSETAPDPYIYLTFLKLETAISAENYPYCALVYRCPTDNSVQSSSAEIFFSTNASAEAVGGQSAIANVTASGKYAYALFNPGVLSGWSGTVTAIRLDYFVGTPGSVANGDTMYVHDVIFGADAASARSAAEAIVADLNAPDETTLTFDVGGKCDAPAEQTVKRGEKPVRPDDPQADGYIFDDWYTSTTYSKPFDFGAVMTKDSVAYAKWFEAVTITFDCGEGVDGIAPITLKKNGRAEAPADPEREGYEFGGWFTDAEYTEQFSFTASVKQSVELRAKWEEAKAVIPGDVNGDGKLNARDVVLLMKACILPFTPPDNYVAQAADINGDGKLNARDVTALMKAMVAK